MMTVTGHPALWHLSSTSVAEQLRSDERQGLTRAEAQARLLRDGPNELDQPPTRPMWLRFLDQFANTMIVVLLIAAAITAAIGEATDAIVIGVIVVLNAAIGFVQEYRAERAMAALSDMTAATARVVRDGQALPIAARDVVVGDLVLLESGDVVAADGRLVDAAALRLNEASLTGESTPVDKTASALPADAGEHLAERENMVFKGTAVAAGRGMALVTATAMDTEFGRIAGLLQSQRSAATPLQRRLAVLGRRLAAAAVIICAILFVTGVARGEAVTVMFLTAVSLAVAAIPEALPAVVTIGLALGAQRMARHNAVVRTLPAVETLGSVTVICTDKTGTLTQGRMQVDRVWTADGELTVTGAGFEPVGEFLDGGRPLSVMQRQSFVDLAKLSVLCNDASLLRPEEGRGTWDIVGDPTEGALLVMAAKAGLTREELNDYPRIAEIPFDSAKKVMATVHDLPDGDVLVAAKGAFEALLPRLADAGSAEDGSAPDLVQAQRLSEEYATQGFRVLAVAGRRFPSLPGELQEVEADLTLYGLVAMADPLRPESAAAVQACQGAGIVPVMITGDHPATAGAIATQLGLLQDRRVVAGSDITALLKDGGVADIAVYARATPQQKLAIIDAWHDLGQTVAMTGDGVNDAPALRRADIGVAMGVTGTEVSKEAAAMVLADDNFATIVSAVREGRRIYDNIRRFVRYTLTSNSGEIWVMFLAPFVGLSLPLLPVHILWINLVTDGLPGLALGVEPPERNVMRRPPRSPAENIFALGLWQHVLLVGLLMGAIPLALGMWGLATGRPWQTMVFTSLALLQLGHALAVRSETESLRSLGLLTNRPLILAVVGTLVLQLALIYLPAGQDLLHTEALSLNDLLIVLAASTGVFWVVELEKLVRRWARRRTEEGAG